MNPEEAQASSNVPSTADIAALSLQVSALRHAMQHHAHVMRAARLPLRHGWLRIFVSDLETNPRTQYKVHLWGAAYWLLNFILVPCLFFLASGLWLRLGVFITLIYSVYANFATDYGAMSAAMASFQVPAALPEIPLEPEAGQGRNQ